MADKEYVCFSPIPGDMKRRIKNLFKDPQYTGEDILLDYMMIYTRGRSEKETEALYYFRDKLIGIIDDGLKYRYNKG